MQRSTHTPYSNPAPAGYVGNRALVADEIGRRLQRAVHGAVQPARLALVAVDAVRDLLWRIAW